MSRRSVVAFLERPGSVRALLQGPGSGAASCYVVADSWPAQQEARAVGLAGTLLDDLLDPATAGEANAAVCAMRRAWYADQGEDFTVYRGVSLGSLVEFELSYTVLFPLARVVYAAVRCLAQHCPELVVTDAPPDSLTGRALALVCRSQGACLETVAPPAGPVAEPQYREQVPATPLAGSLRRWVGRLAGGALARLAAWSRGPGSAAGKGRLLFYYYAALAPVLEEWVARGLGPRLLFDPAGGLPRGSVLHFARAGGRFLRAGAALPFPDAGRAARAMRQRWERLRARHGWARLCGIDVFQALAPTVDAYVHGRFPVLAREVAALHQGFARDRVTCVVVPFDVSERSRMLVEVAAARRIPSVVVQHGLGASALLDDDKKLVDHALVWSEPVRDQLVSWGHDRTRLYVTGNPMFDRYHGDAGETRAAAPSSRPAVLVLTASAIRLNVRKDSTISERYLRLVLDALGRLEQRPRVILRPHPAERPEYYRRLLDEWGETVDAIAGGPFAQHVLAADVVVSPVSTGVLEAWLVGTPVIVISDCAWGVDYPLEGTTEIPSVAAAGPLADALARALAQRGPRSAAGASPVRAYCGPADGRSAARTVEFIDRLRRGQSP